MNARLLLLVTLLAAAPLAAADAPGKAEKLAGEDDKAIPTAVPTAQGDERGPIKVSRTPQAASAFDLPAFVVTGSGERKALARRDDMGTHLDTSGGLKTSPGEAGAGKDQLEAQAVRAGAEQTTYTSKPFVGRLRINGGSAATYGLDGMVAQELGAAWWSLQANANGDEGGNMRAPMTEKAVRDQGHSAVQAGWRFDEGRSVSAFAYGDYSNVNATAIARAELGSLRYGGGAEWRGPVLGMGSTLKMEGGRAFAGLCYTSACFPSNHEDNARIELGVEKRLNGRTGSALLEAGVEFETLFRRIGFDENTTIQMARGTLLSTFEPWYGSRLGVGVDIDGISGDRSAFQLAPRLRFEQRLGVQVRLQARVDGGIAVSRVNGPAFFQAQRLPDGTLKPAMERLDAAAKLAWQPSPGFQLWAEGFVKQVDDQFLPSAIIPGPYYKDTTVRSFRLLGARLGQRWKEGAWWQSLEGTLQRPELPDLGGATPTFLPWGSGEAAFGGKIGIYGAELRGRLTGDQHAALDGSLPLAATVDISAKVDATFNEAWTVYLEGHNLAGQPVEPLALYPSPSPYVGAGVELRF